MRTNRTAAVFSSLGALALLATLFISPAGATGTERGSDRDRKSTTERDVADDGDNRHPSGRDRSVESGGSGTQGRAQSDPDDDGRGPDRSNGGADKPGGSGGVDKDDQDGNNGCGNDDDFEDDNEGWCGGKPKPAKPESKPAKPDSGRTDSGREGRCHKDMPADRCEHKPGAGTATIEVDADCHSVHVTSSKDISHVVVTFADGTSEKFDGLTGHTWTKTFTKTVTGAKAKSATTVVSDMAGSCDEAAAGATTDDDDADDDDDEGRCHKDMPADRCEHKPGAGTATIEVDADCHSVHVTSSKDISHVVVTFADGTSEKFDGLTGHTWTKTFTKTVTGAKAKSATTVVSDMAGSCDDEAAAGATTDDDDADKVCVDDDTMAAADERCNDTTGAGADSDDDKVCVDDDTMTTTDGDASTSDDDACVVVEQGEVLALEAIQSIGGGASVALPSTDTDTAVLGAELEGSTDTNRGVLASVSAGALAFTGDHIMMLTIIALLAMVVGTVLVRQTRRSRIEA